MESGTLAGLPDRSVNHGKDGARARNAAQHIILYSGGDSHCNCYPYVVSW